MDINASLGIAQTAATFITGGAIAYFAYITYHMSKQVTDLRYSPILEICPSGSPKAGTFYEKRIKDREVETQIIYQGVKWEIYLMNPGDVPVFAEDIDVFIKYRPSSSSHEEVLTSIGKLCDLLDETGNILIDRAIWVNGHSQRKITILMCRDDNKPMSYGFFKQGDTVRMSLGFYQKRGLGRQPGRREKMSDLFQLPDKFSVEITMPQIY
jgi:hypothetical protein